MDCYIFDLDGTLADCKHRLHWIKNKPKRFDKFYEEMDKDVPIKGILEIWRSIMLTAVSVLEKKHIIISTGRPEKYRRKTQIWIQNEFISYTDLYMRPDGDYRPDYEVKKEHLDKIREKYNVLGAFDDRKQVLKMYQENGIWTFDCSQGEEF